MRKQLNIQIITKHSHEFIKLMTLLALRRSFTTLRRHAFSIASYNQNDFLNSVDITCEIEYSLN